MKLLNSVSVGHWLGTAIAAGYGGHGQNSAAWTGLALASAGTWSASTGSVGTVMRGSGAGVTPAWGALNLATDVGSSRLTYANMVQMATNRILGRQAASTGNQEVLALASNNGVAFDWATAGTLKISTPQDLRTVGSPGFVGLTLTAASGINDALVIGTGAGISLEINGAGTLGWDGFGAQLGFNSAAGCIFTSGYAFNAQAPAMGEYAIFCNTSGDAAMQFGVTGAGVLHFGNGNGDYDLTLQMTADPFLLETNGDGFKGNHLFLNPTSIFASTHEITNDSNQLALWVDSSDLAGWAEKLMFAHYANVTVVNTAAETTLLSASKIGTLQVPASRLKLGKTLRFTLMGQESHVGTPVLTIKIKAGATVLATFTGTVTSATGSLWRLDADVLVTAVGASGNLRTMGLMQMASANYNTPRTLAPTAIQDAVVNTTVPQTLNVTATWGTQSSSNTITCSHASVEVLA